MKKHVSGLTNKILLATIISFISFSLLQAQGSGKTDSRFIYNAAETNNSINVTLTVAKNYFVHNNTLKLALKNSKGTELKAITIPKAIKKDTGTGKKELIYPEGKWVWKFKKDKSPPYSLRIFYQGCSVKPYVCYPPKIYKKNFMENLKGAKTTVLDKGKAKSKAEIDLFEIHSSSRLISSLINRGGLWIFLVALLGGIFSVFTPCVLPLLPITLAVLGAGKNVPKKQAVLRSFNYVIGIVLTFTTLAAIAALSGKAFGATVLSNPAVLIIFAIFFFIMSFSLFGFLNFRLPTKLQVRLNSVGGESNAGAFMMGLVAGFLALPCTGPILATLLGIAAASSNLLYGISLLVIYAFGFGFPIFIIGIGWMRTPKSGNYMIILKSLVGIVILVLSFFLLAIAISPLQRFLTTPSFAYKLIALLFVILGAIFGAFHGDGHSPRRRERLPKIAAVLLLSFGIVWLIKIPVGKAQLLNWESNLSKAFYEANDFKKPVIVDFTADWCSACKELEFITFSNSKVVHELKNNWILARVNGTKNTPALSSILKTYRIKGFPTVIIFSPDRKEIARFTGYVDAKKFLEILDNSYQEHNKM